MGKLGVIIVGVGGAVASTVVGGVELMRKGLVPRMGMITEATPTNATGLPNLLDFAPLEDLVFGGWDVRGADLYTAALHHNVLPASTLGAVKDELARITPWPATISAPAADGANVARAESMRDQVALIESDIRAFKERHGLESAVMVNLASTESYIEQAPVHETLEAFERGLAANHPAISPAMLYFYAANRARVPYCNFTPSLTNVPALRTQAEAAGNPFTGVDGKTGQTLVKTALASMFRLRQLMIEGWYSVNFLGNNDGLVLASPGPNKTKVLSKASVLDSIVGYPVENHQVHIHYYKPRGDAKEAWDNVDIVGFGGVRMQMKVNFLCQDSALAAPLVLDLVRLLDVAQRCGERGIQRQLSVFFKSPDAAADETPTHDLFKQEQLLLDWARTCSSRIRATAKRAPSNGRTAGNGAAHSETTEATRAVAPPRDR